MKQPEISRRHLLTTAAVGVPAMGVLGAVNYFGSPAANARTVVADGWWGTSTTKALQEFPRTRSHRQGGEPTRFLGRVESRPGQRLGMGSRRRRAGRTGDQVPAVVRGCRPGRSDRSGHHPGAPGQVRAGAGRDSGRSFSDHPGASESYQRWRPDLILGGGETAVAQQLDAKSASSRSRGGVECCATVYFARAPLHRFWARAPGRLIIR